MHIHRELNPWLSSHLGRRKRPEIENFSSFQQLGSGMYLAPVSPHPASYHRTHLSTNNACTEHNRVYVSTKETHTNTIHTHLRSGLRFHVDSCEFQIKQVSV